MIYYIVVKAKENVLDTDEKIISSIICYTYYYIFILYNGICSIRVNYSKNVEGLDLKFFTTMSSKKAKNKRFKKNFHLRSQLLENILLINTK